MSITRLRQMLLLITFIPWCWLAMMVAHECGHVVAACITGATIERVVLHPLAISRTDLGENPHPLLVSWAGALVGSVVPLMAWALAAWCAVKWSPKVRFFAGFVWWRTACILASEPGLAMAMPVIYALPGRLYGS